MKNSIKLIDEAVFVSSFSGKLSILTTSRKELVGRILRHTLYFNFISFITQGQLIVTRREKSTFSPSFLQLYVNVNPINHSRENNTTTLAINNFMKRK